jgi:hypothetical protein
MSVTQRVKQGFLRLPFARKTILISSGILALSPLLPWYDNRNSFGIGESYLGIQGPLFLIGFLIMGFGIINFSNLFFPLLGKNFFQLRRKTGATSFMLGAQGLLLLVLANSVFFHPAFGEAVNKKSGAGMFVAFMSLGIMLVSGYLARRKDSEEEPEPIEMVNEIPEITPTQSYTAPVQAYERPHVSPQQVSSVDPLTLDPKTRYKMMQAQMRQNQITSGAPANYWGSGSNSNSPYQQ